MGERESMVERVARAIASASRMDPGGDWMAFDRQARAAIMAMRAPTEKMAVAGVSGDPDEDAQTWRQMIDAALAE